VKLCLEIDEAFTTEVEINDVVWECCEQLNGLAESE
jgi:hypothetical protein